MTLNVHVKNRNGYDSDGKGLVALVTTLVRTFNGKIETSERALALMPGASTEITVHDSCSYRVDEITEDELRLLIESSMRVQIVTAPLENEEQAG